MSWAGDRLAFLSERYSYREIRELTGVPESTISYVIRGERKLGAQYILNVRSAYSRTVYRELRDAGASVYVARKYTWRSTASVAEFLGESDTMVRNLADYRLEQYADYLRRQGRYVSEEDTRSVLIAAIKKSMARSPIDLGRHEGGDSPSLRHFTAEPDE
jgi:hypothetical protein